MTPGNDHPEIPSFKPTTGKEEEKKGTGIVPSSAKPAPSSGFKFPGFGGGSTGSKAFSAPNLKVRGLGGGGSTVMDRLKNLRKKDLIFIAAGLCTLGMAPLAEHLLMSPDEQTAKLQEGFNSQQGPLFQDGSSVYEPGNGVGSPGGLVGSGSDVITPLNVRDPSNLIMSPGAQKKADAVVAAPPAASAAPKDDSDWKNALSGAARSGASKAAQQTPRPRPNVGKMAGAIRGLSALGGGGGGTGASLKLDALSASNVPNRAAGSNALTRSQATPGFRGVTARSGSSSGAGEDLRAAGAKQSDIFNKGGGASAALDSASREAIPSGGQGFGGGRPGEGGETKNPGGNSQKDNKSLGESLAFLRQKMEMEKSLDLKWERKKWNEFGRQKMMEESAMKLGFDMFGKFAEKAFIGPLGDMVGQAVAGGGGPQVGWECKLNSGQTVRGTTASLATKNVFVKGGIPYCGKNEELCGTCTQAVINGDSGGAAPNPNQDGRTPSEVGRTPGGGTLPGVNMPLDQICSDIQGASGRSAIPAGLKSSMLTAAKELLTARNNLYGNSNWACGSEYKLGQLSANPTSVSQQLEYISQKVAANKKAMETHLSSLAEVRTGLATKLGEKKAAVLDQGFALKTKQGVTGANTAIAAPFPQFAQAEGEDKLKAKNFDTDFPTVGPWGKMDTAQQPLNDTIRGVQDRHDAVKAVLGDLKQRLATANSAIGGMPAVIEPLGSDVALRDNLKKYHQALAAAYTEISGGHGQVEARSTGLTPQHAQSRLAYEKVGTAAGTLRVTIGAPTAGQAYGAPVPSGPDISIHQNVTSVAAIVPPSATDILGPSGRLVGLESTDATIKTAAEAVLDTEYTSKVTRNFEAVTKALGNEGSPVKTAQAATAEVQKIGAAPATAP